MIANEVRFYFWGALSMACVMSALFFLRYWKSTHERLFAFFAIAFGVMGLNWLSLAFIDPGEELRHILYLLRLLAFVLIIVGIVDKNRRSSR